MPPDPVNDDILTEPTPGDPPTAAASFGQPNIDEAVAKALEGPLGQIGTAMQTLNQRMEGLVAPEAPEAPDAPQGGGSPNDYQEFIDLGPKAYIEKYGANQGAERLAATQSMILGQQGKTTLETQRSDIDKTYGEGVFEEHFVPRINNALANIQDQDAQTAARASDEYMQSLVSGVLGTLQRDDTTGDMLVSKKAEQATLRTQQENAGILGGGRPMPTGGKQISGDEQEFINALNSKGMEYSKEDYIKDRDTGNTQGGWEKRFAKESK